jgi:hypothetical protein
MVLLEKISHLTVRCEIYWVMALLVLEGEILLAREQQ